MKFARTIAILLLMLALPLQAVAAFAMTAACTDDPAAAVQISHDGHAMHATADGHDHQAAGHQHPGDESSPDQAGHTCCHHLFTGAAAAIAQAAPETPQSVTRRVSLLQTLHIPELPQRPPRA